MLCVWVTLSHSDWLLMVGMAASLPCDYPANPGWAEAWGPYGGFLRVSTYHTVLMGCYVGVMEVCLFLCGRALSLI